MKLGSDQEQRANVFASERLAKREHAGVGVCHSQSFIESIAGT
jgi:hypothetical protein